MISDSGLLFLGQRDEQMTGVPIFGNIASRCLALHFV